MTTVHKVRLTEQTQGTLDLSDISTSETDTTLVAAPDGSGGIEFRAEAGGGGGECDHEHVRERFVATGGTPETFGLAFAPTGVTSVFVQGVLADPDDVTVTGSDVEVDTTAADVVVILYEHACGEAPAGVLAFPGTSFYYDDFTFDVNELASFVTTGPAIVVIDISVGIAGDDTVLWISDDPTSPYRVFLPYFLYWSGDLSFDGSVPGRYVFIAPTAGTYHILANEDGAYDPGLTGTGTYAVLYPTGTPTSALSFPGADGSGSSLGNILASDTIAVPSVVFITTTADLPADYRFGVKGDVSGERSYTQFDTGQPFFAGTYPVVIDPTDATIDVFAYDQTTGGVTYDGGLTGSGSYEIVVLP